MINSINIVFPNTAAEAEKLPDIQKAALAALLTQHSSQTRFETGAHKLNSPFTATDGRVYTEVKLSHVITKTSKKSNPTEFAYRVIDPKKINSGMDNEINHNLYKINLNDGSVTFKQTKRPKVNRRSFRGKQSPASYFLFNFLYGHCRRTDNTNALLPKLPGENLEERLSRKPEFTPEDAATVARGCASEIEKLHIKAKYTHGDIHLGNFMVDPNTMDVKIIDLDYSGPINQQNNNEKLRDIYQLGSVLNEIFEHTTPKNGCPRLLKDFLQRMMSQNPDGSPNPDPNDRPSIQEVVAVLQLHQEHALTPETLYAVAQLSEIDFLNPETLHAVMGLNKINLLTPETVKAVAELSRAYLPYPEIVNMVIQLKNNNFLTSKISNNDLFYYSFLNSKITDIDKRLKKCSSLDEIKKLIDEAKSVQNNIINDAYFDNKAVQEFLYNSICKVLNDTTETKEKLEKQSKIIGFFNGRAAEVTFPSQNLNETDGAKPQPKFW